MNTRGWTSLVHPDLMTDLDIMTGVWAILALGGLGFILRLGGSGVSA